MARPRAKYFRSRHECSTYNICCSPPERLHIFGFYALSKRGTREDLLRLAWFSFHDFLQKSSHFKVFQDSQTENSGALLNLKARSHNLLSRQFFEFHCLKFNLPALGRTKPDQSEDGRFTQHHWHRWWKQPSFAGISSADIMDSLNHAIVGQIDFQLCAWTLGSHLLDGLQRACHS